MRLWVVRFACVLVLVSSSASFGQEPSGPQTLENLLKSDDSEQSAAPAGADGTDAVPKRPSGTVIRDRDAVQHPELDKAWADYDAAVAKASKGIQAAIAKQFDAATSRGDLDAAVTWQEIGEKFEKAGEIPTASEINGVVSAAVNDYEKARELLSKAYESTVKVLTKEKKIAEAKAVRAESLSIQAAVIAGATDVGASAIKQRASTGKEDVYLADLLARDVSVGYGAYGKNGDLGYDNIRVSVQGIKYSKTIGVAPHSNGYGKAVFDIPEGCVRFEATAAINDSAQRNQKTALIFKVYGGNRLLWTSKPLYGGGSSEKCSVPLKGVKSLTLVVECPGPNDWSHSVWLDPHVTPP
jgi:hypothetical protein